MAKDSTTRNLFFELVDRLSLFMTEGTRGPYAAAMGRSEYEAMIEAQERKWYRQHLYRLKQQKLLKIREQGDRLIIALTKKGSIEWLKHKIFYTKRMLPKGKICLVSFDVPEDVRDARAVLRNFLKTSDFERIHQSLWCTDRDAVKPLTQLIHTLRLEKWVRVFIAQLP